MQRRAEIRDLLLNIKAMYDAFLEKLEGLFGKSVSSLKLRALLDVLNYIVSKKDASLSELIKSADCGENKPIFSLSILESYKDVIAADLELSKKILCLGCDGLIDFLSQRALDEEGIYHLIVIVHIIYNNIMQELVNLSNEKVLNLIVRETFRIVSDVSWRTILNDTMRHEAKKAYEKGNFNNVLDVLMRGLRDKFGYKAEIEDYKDTDKSILLKVILECPYASDVHIKDKADWGLCTFSIMTCAMLEKIGYSTEHIKSLIKDRGSINYIKIKK